MTDHGPEHIGPQPLAGYVMRNYGEAIATLRNSRESQRLSQAAVSARLGTTQAAMSRREVGSRRGSPDDLFDLAHALGYDLALIPREDTDA